MTGRARAGLLTALRQGFLDSDRRSPKVVVFFGSIFFALLPSQSPLWVMLAAVGIVFVERGGLVVASVSVLFSAPRPRGAYMRLKAWIDRAMAGALALIGAKLIADAR